MKTGKFTVEQITLAVRRVEGGHPVGDVCSDRVIAEATFYRWKKQ